MQTDQPSRLQNTALRVRLQELRRLPRGEAHSPETQKRLREVEVCVCQAGPRTQTPTSPSHQHMDAASLAFLKPRCYGPGCR